MKQSINYINYSLDDRDLLLRKANYLKHGSIVTPEHSSRRINAAKNFEDCEFSKRAASQSKPCSSQADPEVWIGDN